MIYLRRLFKVPWIYSLLISMLNKKKTLLFKGKYNKERYIICTQDKELKRELRQNSLNVIFTLEKKYKKNHIKTINFAVET